MSRLPKAALGGLFFLLIVPICWIAFQGLPTRKSWHQKVGWVAESFFRDVDVIALCRAIEASDESGVRAAIRAGVDVNNVGKDGMTPLLWAFPEDRISIFRLLLESGAIPNVTVASDLGTHGAIECGSTVAHLAAKSSFSEHFFAIVKHGVDPNLAYTPCGQVLGCTLLTSVLRGDAIDKVVRMDALIDAGADSSTFDLLAIEATDSAEYDVALILLKANAGFRTYNEWGKLIHHVILSEKQSQRLTPAKRTSFLELAAWLEAHGEDTDVARKDVERWFEYSRIDSASGAVSRLKDIERLKAKDGNG